MKAARISSSAAVPRSTPRQPVPRMLPARVGFHVRRLPRIPLALLAMGLLAAGIAAFNQYLEETETFHLRDVLLIGGDRITKEHVLRHLEGEGYGLGEMSLLHVSPRQVEKTLAMMTELETVTVERLWPDHLLVEITEHQPAGIYISDTGSYVYTEDGYLFARADGRDFNRLRGPFLTGLQEESLKPGTIIPQTAFAKARSYMDAFHGAAPDLYASLSEIRWEEEDGVTLLFRGGEQVRCGKLPPRETGPMVEALLRRRGAVPHFETARLLSPEHLVLGPPTARTSTDTTEGTQLASGE